MQARAGLDYAMLRTAKVVAGQLKRCPRVLDMSRPKAKLTDARSPRNSGKTSHVQLVAVGTKKNAAMDQESSQYAEMSVS